MRRNLKGEWKTIRAIQDWIIFSSANLNHVYTLEDNAVMLLFHSCWTTLQTAADITMTLMNSLLTICLLFPCFLLCNTQTFKKRKYLFLLDFQVNLSFQGNQFGQIVQALRGVPGCQEGQEDRVAPECCYGIQKESGWASCQLCSFDLQGENQISWKRIRSTL